MADDFMTPPSGEGWLTSEQRREMSLLNLAQSRASKARKKKRKKQPAPKVPTETQQRAKEQARIQAERDYRRAMSEANRREAGIGTVEPPESEEPVLPEQQVDMPEENDININIELPPEDPIPEPEPEPEQKEPQKKQKKSTTKRSVQGSRYGKNEHAAAAYPNRITTGGAIALGILTGLLIGTVIYGRVQTNEIYTELASLQAEYDELVSKNTSMKSEMDGKMTVKNIEDYAENVLGLMSLDQSQIQYIRLQTEDEVVISQPEDNFIMVLNDFLVSFWEFLRGR